MRHPLYNRVQEIVTKRSVGGMIKNSDFGSIRNQASVRAILIGMGYKPNCQVSPYSWRLPTVDESKNQGFITPRQHVITELKNGRTIRVVDIDLPTKYLSSLVSTVRASGVIIESVCDPVTKQVVWYKPLSGKPKVEHKPIVKGDMPTVAGQKVLDALKKNGEYHIKDFKLSRKYLGKILGDIRKMGYQLKTIKNGKRAVAYKLDGQ